MRSIVGAGVLAVMALTHTAAQEEGRSRVGPLFDSNDPIEFILRAPLETLFDDRDEDAPPQEATVRYLGAGGDSIILPLEIELRGNNRRRKRTCSFPPIRLDFPRDSVNGTWFENQNRLKVVTQCRENRDEYGRYVVLEYLLYRAYNTLTDMSFRVRFANVLYQDTDGEMDPIARPAFLIEDDDAVAERLGYEVIEIPGVMPYEVDEEQLQMVELFQYMIGHTDWSALMAEPGEMKCCHNGRLIGDIPFPVYTVPYDFDFSGVVNARYAETIEGQRNVRQRVYRGYCHSPEASTAVAQRFRDNQEAIYDVFRNNDQLEEKEVERVIDYLDDFYDDIKDDRNFERRILRDCREVPS